MWVGGGGSIQFGGGGGSKFNVVPIKRTERVKRFHHAEGEGAAYSFEVGLARDTYALAVLKGAQ